jgi:hypothetical protein
MKIKFPHQVEKVKCDSASERVAEADHLITTQSGNVSLAVMSILAAIDKL